jgi:hypothetical protein
MKFDAIKPKIGRIAESLRCLGGKKCLARCKTKAFTALMDLLTLRQGNLMKILKNSGSERAVDELRASLGGSSSLDLATPQFSLFAYAELKEALGKLENCRLILPTLDSESLALSRF